MAKHVHGGDVYRYSNCIDFSTNCNPLGTPKRVREAAQESLFHIHEYPQVGYQPLKEAIGAYEGVPSYQVICGNGAAELVFSVCRALSPKRALVTAPTFAEYEQALDSVGCQVRHFTLRPEHDFAVEEELLDCLTPELDLVFLCNPNNPTGILTGRSFLLKILERCRQMGIFLVVDECFLDFVKEPEAYTLKEWLLEYQNLFLLKAFTKRYAMAGLRLGYGLSANTALLEKITAENQPWNISTPAQAAGLAALKETAYVEEGRQLIFREREYLKEELSACGMQVFPSQANYVFFRGPVDLFETCVSRGILIRDCSNYPGLCRGYYRIAVKTHEDNVKLIRTLQEICHCSQTDQ